MITAEEARVISRRDGSLDEEKVNDYVKDIMTRAEKAITTDAEKGLFYASVASGQISDTSENAININAAYTIAAEKLHELGYTITFVDEYHYNGFRGFTMAIFWSRLL